MEGDAQHTFCSLHFTSGVHAFCLHVCISQAASTPFACSSTCRRALKILSQPSPCPTDAPWAVLDALCLDAPDHVRILMRDDGDGQNHTAMNVLIGASNGAYSCVGVIRTVGDKFSREGLLNGVEVAMLVHGYRVTQCIHALKPGGNHSSAAPGLVRGGDSGCLRAAKARELNEVFVLLESGSRPTVKVEAATVLLFNDVRRAKSKTEREHGGGPGPVNNPNDLVSLAVIVTKAGGELRCLPSIADSLNLRQVADFTRLMAAGKWPRMATAHHGAHNRSLLASLPPQYHLGQAGGAASSTTAAASTSAGAAAPATSVSADAPTPSRRGRGSPKVSPEEAPARRRTRRGAGGRD